MRRLRRSFRAKIMGLTVLVAALVLGAFGLISNYALYEIKIASVDQNMRLFPLRELPHPWVLQEIEARRGEGFPERALDRLERLTERLFGRVIFTVVYGAEGQVFFQSDDWPAEVGLEALPAVEGELQALDGPELELLRRRGMGPGPGRGLGPGSGTRWRGRDFDDAVEPVFRNVDTDSGSYRFSVFRLDGYNVATGIDLGGVREEMANARLAFVLALPFALAVLGVGAWFIAGRAIKPVRKLTQAAESVSAKRLDARIAKEGEDAEFEALIEVFNSMLARLERSFQQANRFSADAAHELKTPLAILQGHLEVGLQRAEVGSEEQKRAAMLLEEVERLKGMTRKLLLLAHADAGRLSIHVKEFEAQPLVREAVDDFEVQYPQFTYKLRVAEGAKVKGDEELLGQILRNLLSNAIKYSDERREVALQGDVVDGFLQIVVSNTGEPVGEDMRERLFERFARGDSSRSRSVDGLGLGLSLSREFARAMGGELEFAGSGEGWNRFRLRLPLA